MLQTPSAGSPAAVGGGFVALQHYCEGAMAVVLHPWQWCSIPCDCQRVLSTPHPLSGPAHFMGSQLGTV
jgi:hypothetical protein